MRTVWQAIISGFEPILMEKLSCEKKVCVFQRIWPSHFITSRYENESSCFCAGFATTTWEKYMSGGMLGEHPTDNSSDKCLIRSGGIPSLGQISIDKNNDCVMKSEPCALDRGWNPPSGHSVQNTAGYLRQAPARSPAKTFASKNTVLKRSIFPPFFPRRRPRNVSIWSFLLTFH